MRQGEVRASQVHCRDALANPDTAYRSPAIAPFHGGRYRRYFRAAKQPARIALLGRAAVERACAGGALHRGLQADGAGIVDGEVSDSWVYGLLRRQWKPLQQMTASNSHKLIGGIVK